MNGPNGEWVGLGLRDSDPEVSRVKAFLRRKFSYAADLNDTPLYDQLLADVVTEMQRRYGLPATGIWDYATKLRCGYLTPPPVDKPWLFTVHGTGQPDPAGPGLPADTARACLDKYQWQPIGNYSAAAFPMWPSITQGIAELIGQIATKPGKFALAGYSQGAIVVGQVLKHQIMDPAGQLHHRLGDVTKVVFWGNPMRQTGIQAFDDWIWRIAPADSHGILEDRLEGLHDASFQVRDYAHAGDMYACNRDNDTDEYKRAICKIIMRATDFFAGPDSIVHQLGELAERPLQEGIAMASAIIDAGRFFTGTAHGYNIGPAIDFLRS